MANRSNEIPAIEPTIGPAIQAWLVPVGFDGEDPVLLAVGVTVLTMVPALEKDVTETEPVNIPQSAPK